MVGKSARDAHLNVERAFGEFGRVLKPGGALFVFEMAPAPFFQLVQALCWDVAKRLLRAELDMHFFSARSMRRIGQEMLPKGSTMEMTPFRISPFTTIAPIFALPRFKVYKVLFPLNAVLYKWHMPHN